MDEKRRRIRTGAASLLLMLSVTAGCTMTQTPADEAALAEAKASAVVPSAQAWPERWTEGLRAGVLVDAAAPSPEDGKPGVTRRLLPVGRGLAVARLPRPPAGLTAPDELWAWRESEDALRIVRTFTFLTWESGGRPGWDLPGGRSENPDDTVLLERAAARASVAARFRLMMPGDPGTRRGDRERAPGVAAARRVRESGADDPARSKLLRGLVLFVPPIAAADLSLPLPRELSARGWAVLSVDRLEVLQYSRRVTSIEVPWLHPAPRVGRSTPAPREPQPTAAGRWLGEWIRGDMGDMAYCFEAGLDVARRIEPSLRDVPVVVIGASLGAIFTPPVVARLGDEVDAAVLIGGGASMLRVMADTDPSVFNVSLVMGGGDLRLTPQRGRKWEGVYLQHNPLDPMHTAPLLAKIPTLMVHASKDGIVPAATGDLLWERAGRPERWSLDAGHTYLFWSLDERAGAIADWLGAHAPPAAADGG